jgi:thymidylate synthase
MGLINKLDLDYQALLQDILDNGVDKKDRTGTGTISVFGRQIRHNMKDGFPLLTTKKMPFKTIVTELLWFLRGDTNIKYLVDNNCHIWDGDAYKNWCRQFEVDLNNFNGEEVAKGHNDQCWGYPVLDHVKPTSKEYKRGQINAYLEGKADKPFFYLTQEEFINRIKTDDEFAKKWGNLGPIYGKQWRKWPQYKVHQVTFPTGQYTAWRNEIDQVQNLINDLKTNPDSRRLMVNAWNVGELDQTVLPPCHYGFQVYTRELSLEERWELLEKKVGKELFDSWVSEIVPFGGGLSEYLQSNNIPKRAISLMWNQRSVDTFLGLPFNIASYGLLLEIIAKEVNMVPDQLIGNLGDVHLYSNHIEQAKEQIGREFTEEEILEHLQQSGMDALRHEPRMEYISKLPKRTREPYPLPKLNFNTEWWDKPLFEAVKSDAFCKCLLEEDIQLSNYQSHPTIKAPLSN